MDQPSPFAPAPQHALSNHFSNYGADNSRHHYAHPASAAYAPPPHHGLESAPRSVNGDALFAGPFGQSHHHHHGLPLHISAPPPPQPSPFGQHGRVPTGPLSAAVSTPQQSSHPPTPRHDARFGIIGQGSPQVTQGTFLQHGPPPVEDRESVAAPRSASKTTPAKAKKESSHFEGLKMIPHPPDLEAWREKLFNVQGTLTLSEEEYAIPVSPTTHAPPLNLDLTLTHPVSTGSRPTSRTSTTSTRTARRSGTSGTPASRTTGTAG